MIYLDSLLIKTVLSYFNIKGTLRNMLDYAAKVLQVTSRTKKLGFCGGSMKKFE